MSTFTDILNLSKPASGDESWTTEMNANLDTISEAIAPQYCMFVSAQFSIGNLGNDTASDRRHFPTIQDAIDAIEAKSPTYASDWTIFVYPGWYNEKLTIASASCNIVGVGTSVVQGGLGVAAVIYGNGSDEPIIDITNPAGYSGISFTNLFFSQSYNDANAVEITEPSLIHIKEDGAPTNQSAISFVGCAFRHQTWGDDNHWTDAIRLDEIYAKVRFEYCKFYLTGYGGGNYNGGVDYLFRTQGYGTGYKSQLYLYGCRIHHQSYAADDNYIFHLMNDHHVQADRCDFYKTNYGGGSAGLYQLAGGSTLSEDGLGANFAAANNTNRESASI